MTGCGDNMRGLGTIINTIAVIVGGSIGILLKNGMKEKTQQILMQACGLAVIFIGAAGTLQGMLSVQDGELETGGSMLLIFSLVIGGMIGEKIDIEKRLDHLGERIKNAVKVKGENHFVEGFVNTSLIICVGAMAIVGSIQDGLTGDYSMLLAKSILDFVIVLVFASTCGIGAIFSASILFVYQGGITLLGALAGPVLGDALISNLSYIGSSLIFCVGINIAFGKKFRVGNLLPALLLPVLYEIVSLM